MDIVEKMGDLSPDEKEKIKREIQLLLDNSRFNWPHHTGFFGKCWRWVDEYNERTKNLISEFQKDSNKYFQVNSMYWDTQKVLL